VGPKEGRWGKRGKIGGWEKITNYKIQITMFKITNNHDMSSCICQLSTVNCQLFSHLLIFPTSQLPFLSQLPSFPLAAGGIEK
jgi:hypothetical protein